MHTVQCGLCHEVLHRPFAFYTSHINHDLIPTYQPTNYQPLSLGIIAAHWPGHAVPCRFMQFELDSCRPKSLKKRLTQPSHRYSIALKTTMLLMMLCPQYISIVGIIANNFRKLCDTFCIVFFNMILMSEFFRCGINLFVLMPSIFSTHWLLPT